jgi:hypothetical protein
MNSVSGLHLHRSYFNVADCASHIHCDSIIGAYLCPTGLFWNHYKKMCDLTPFPACGQFG